MTECNLLFSTAVPFVQREFDDRKCLSTAFLPIRKKLFPLSIRAVAAGRSCMLRMKIFVTRTEPLQNHALSYIIRTIEMGLSPVKKLMLLIVISTKIPGACVNLQVQDRTWPSIVMEAG